MHKANHQHREAMASYIKAVQSGARIAGKLERDMVQRHLDDLERKENDESFGYVFSDVLADRACDFFSHLRHTDGEYSGQPFELYPWQTFILRSLFGWVHREGVEHNGQIHHYRRFREAFITVGRGNGKTPFGAGIMLYLFAGDWPREDRAEVYCSAVKRDQAALAFNAAKRFVERSPGLRKKIQTLKHHMSNQTDGTLGALSSDGKSADGLNIHGLLRDEVHAWTSFQREYYEKLATAFGKRRQPLAVTITTAGSEESHIWQEERNFAASVVDRDSPIESDSLFAAIYEIDDGDSELDEKAWAKANPMLEHKIVKINYLRDLAAKAKVDPGVRSQLRRYHANKYTRSEQRAYTEEVWACGRAEIPWEDIETVYVGVDVGISNDLSAVGCVAPLDWVTQDGKKRQRYAIWCQAWAAAGSKRDFSREPWRGFIDSGQLIIQDSEVIDSGPLRDWIADLAETYRIKSVAVDKHNAAQFAVDVQNDLGLDTYLFPQNHAKFNEPMREFHRALVSGRVFHGDASLLGWATLNVVQHENNQGLIMPVKKKSVDKIDPFVAVCMSFSECIFTERPGPSVYSKRGPIVV